MPNQKAFTLIETLVYLALFIIIIGGMLVAVFQIIESSNKTETKIIVQEEANFLLRKLDWALTGASSVSQPPSGSSGAILRLSKDGHTLQFDLSGNFMRLQRDSAATQALNSSNVTITNLSFQHIPSSGIKPDAVKATFQINGQSFETTKYSRYEP